VDTQGMGSFDTVSTYKILNKIPRSSHGIFQTKHLISSFQDTKMEFTRHRYNTFISNINYVYVFLFKNIYKFYLYYMRSRRTKRYKYKKKKNLEGQYKNECSIILTFWQHIFLYCGFYYMFKPFDKF
jgi:hypothetical protein